MRLVEGRDEISLVEYKVFVKMHVRDRALIARVAWINGSSIYIVAYFPWNCPLLFLFGKNKKRQGKRT